MINYDRPSYPTIYRGVQYRSRLEARWAAFFDLAGWTHEYEPLDLGSWSPDFLLKGHYYPILCEVKPISDIDANVCTKMADAATKASFRGELLLLGISPFTAKNSWDGWLGWLDDGLDPWFDITDGYEPVGASNNAYGEFRPCWGVMAPGDRLDFCHSTNAFCGRITGAWSGDHYTADPKSTPAPRLWSEACNIVQWKSPVSRRKV